jgi:hypothetical protein
VSHSARNVSGIGDYLRWNSDRAEDQLERVFQWADQELPPGAAARLCEDPVHGPALDAALAGFDEAFGRQDTIRLGRAFTEFGRVIQAAAEAYRADGGSQ